jgi:outer membrane protein OmpA-like peptidoglycan-associated protein
MLAVLFGALVALVVAFASRQPADEVVVLPGPDGHVGMVVVERDGKRHVLNEAYATSRQGQSEVSRLSPQEVRESFGSTLQSLPSRPALFRLYFVSATDELTDASRAELRKVLDELKQRPIPDIAVIGHTDTVGELEANDVLSAQRAEKVKGFLVEIGIAADRIQVSGRGEREPIVPTADNVDEPRNRRVEISVR